MKKLILLAAVALSLNAYGIMRANADTILLIPGHNYSDGRYYPEYVRLFMDERYINAWEACVSYGKWLHRSRISAPMYSQCSPVETLSEMRAWQ